MRNDYCGWKTSAFYIAFINKQDKIMKVCSSNTDKQNNIFKITSTSTDNKKTTHLKTHPLVQIRRRQHTKRHVNWYRQQQGNIIIDTLNSTDK